MNSEEIKEKTVAEEMMTQKEETETMEATKSVKEEEVQTETKKEKKNKYKEQVEVLQQEIAKMKDDYLRARAEMENTKRRLNDEAIRNRKYAAQNLVTDLINPLDMLVKVSNMENQSPEMNNFLMGFKMISNQIMEILKEDGLLEIEALGKDFDPNIHHAVSKDTKEGIEPNKVLEVLQTGYMYKDRVIKPAMVKVSE